jgi:rod shape-determining protein MreD
MSALRFVLAGALLVTGVMLELVVLARWSMPGATPDLVLVVVVGLAIARGPLMGAGAGFAGGLLLDVVPPSAGIVGLNALVFCMAGFWVGRVAERNERTPLLIIGSAVVAEIGVILAGAALGGLLGEDRVAWEEVPGLALTGALYAAILASFVVPLITSLVGRTEPDYFSR